MDKATIIGIVLTIVLLLGAVAIAPGSIVRSFPAVICMLRDLSACSSANFTLREQVERGVSTKLID